MPKRKTQIYYKKFDSKLTPIERVNFSYTLGNVSKNHAARASIMQFPIKLCWAITSHRCQGQTIKKPLIIQADLNEAFQAAMCYVILSRIMCLAQLYLLTFDPKKIYCNESAKQEAENIKRRALNKKSTSWELQKANTVKISTLNIRSLKKHFIDLKLDDFLQQSDIICINETWLESDPEEKLPDFHGYYLNLWSKGIALYSKEEPIQVQKLVSANGSIIHASYEAFDLISVYRYSDSSSLEAFAREVSDCLNLNKTVIVLGDINIDLKKHPMNNLTKTLINIGFQQIVLSPTHILGGILDHVYAYCKTSAKCTLYKIHPLYYSDHDAVTFFLET